MTYPSSPPVLPTREPPSTPEGWYPDPYGHAPARYWDGQGWTSHLAYPLPERWASGPPPTLRPAAGAMMVAAVTGLIFLIRGTIGAVADVVGSPAGVGYAYVVLFGGMGLVAFAASKWFGTGDVRVDLGLRIKRPDVAVFILGGLTLWITEIVLGILLHLGDVPLRSNSESISSVRDRPALFVVYVVAGVIGAPIFEEICFRGVIQRSLCSWMPAPAAIGVTAALFGVYHFTPALGTGNIGMTLILAVLGVGLGALAQWTGRLAPSMLAHAGLNAIVFTIIWFTAPHFV